MRWWMAALLAVVCIAVGMLIPLPTMEYQGAFVPTEETAKPLVNIGLAEDSTPRPLSTPSPAQTAPVNETIRLAYAQNILAGYADLLAGPQSAVPLDGGQSYNGLLLDIEQTQWFQYDGYRASRAGSRIALDFDAESIRILDAVTGAPLFDKAVSELCGGAAQIAWDIDLFGNIAVCVMDGQGGGSTLLYESATGDETVFEDFCVPRFSPDGASLYLLERKDEENSVLYRVTPPSGQPMPVTADTVSVRAFAPAAMGVVVLGTDTETLEPFLLQMDENGGELHNFNIPADDFDNFDTLFPVDGGHAYLTQTRDGAPQCVLLDLFNRRMSELDPGVIPVALHGDTLLLRDGETYYTTHRISGERTDLNLTR